MSLPLYAKISIGVISMVLIATVGLVVLTIMGKKPKTMKEWMSSADGVNTLTQVLSSLDNTTTFGFNTTWNAKTATTADKAATAESADYAKSAGSAVKLSKMYGPSWTPPPVGSWCGSTDKKNPTYYWSKRHICMDQNTRNAYSSQDWGEPLSIATGN